ncbi:MAG: hypothetical protein K9K38_07950, partial [Rhodoferax sp.]|nr:hypothetical protein [Rhodoferax sp.]
MTEQSGDFDSLRDVRAPGTSPALYPQLFLSSACDAKRESGADHLQTSVALPDQLMTGRWIVKAPK